MWIATFRLNRALWLVFGTLWMTFMLLGVGSAAGMPGVATAGGYLGIVCGSLAMYTSFAEVTNATFGKPVIPIGGRS